MSDAPQKYYDLKRSERRIVEEAFEMETGYVLDFSNRTIEEYFEDKFDIEFYDSRYSFEGQSKAKRLRAILNTVGPSHAAIILRRLWDYRSTLPEMYRNSDPDEEDKTREEFFMVVRRLEGDEPHASTDALFAFDASETLGELLNSIERDIRADKPETALDRLHTYCHKKFAHLLETRSIHCDRNDPLHSKVAKYANSVESERRLSDMSILIIKSSIKIFERFNEVRNYQTFAHDNPLIGTQEARFIFDSVSSILRFVKHIDESAFGA